MAAVRRFHGSVPTVFFLAVVLCLLATVAKPASGDTGNGLYTGMTTPSNWSSEGQGRGLASSAPWLSTTPETTPGDGDAALRQAARDSQSDKETKAPSEHHDSSSEKSTSNMTSKNSNVDKSSKQSIGGMSSNKSRYDVPSDEFNDDMSSKKSSSTTNQPPYDMPSQNPNHDTTTTTKKSNYNMSTSMSNHDQSSQNSSYDRPSTETRLFKPPDNVDIKPPDLNVTVELTWILSPEERNAIRAVQQGVRGQYELCDKFCIAQSRQPWRKRRTGHCSLPSCMDCHCDKVCRLYGDCCPSLEEEVGEEEQEVGEEDEGEDGEEEADGEEGQEDEDSAAAADVDDEMEEVENEDGEVKEEEEIQEEEGEDSLPDIGSKAVLCLQVNVGCRWRMVQVIAGCPPNPRTPHTRTPHPRSPHPHTRTPQNRTPHLHIPQDPRSPQNHGSQQVERCNQCAEGSSLPRRLVLSLTTFAVYCSLDCALCNGETRVTALPNTPCTGAGLSLDYLKAGGGGGSQASGPPTDPHYRSRTRNAFPPTLTTVDIARFSLPVCPQIHESHGADLPRLCNRAATVPARRVSTCDPIFTTYYSPSEVTTMEELCGLYSYPVTSQGTSYRNLFCALCNRVELVERHCNFDYILGEDGPYGVMESERKGLTILTNLRPDTYTYETVKPRQCETEQWYDSVLDSCRNLSCSESRSLVPGQPFCIDAATDETTLTLYRLNIFFSPLANATHLRCFANLAYIHSTVVPLLSHTIAGRLGCNIFTVQVGFFNHGAEWGSFSASVQFFADSKDNQTDFELRITESFVQERLSLKNVGDESTVEFRTRLTRYSNMGTISFLSFANGSCCYVAENTFDVDAYTRRVAAYRYFVRVRELKVVDFDPILPYALVKLASGDLDLIDSDIYNLTYVNASLPAWKVKKIKPRFLVPALFLNEAYVRAGLIQDPGLPVTQPEGMEVMDVVSTICLVVSVVSLAFLLLTYSCFQSLRTLPGVNNMCLAGWLLLAQVLLLTVPGRTSVAWLCGVLGVALHYAWLCVVAWSSVCSFHMFHVFVSQRDRALALHRRGWYYKRYAVAAHGAPGLVVLLVLVVRGGMTGGADMGYGGRVCYLNSVLLVGVAFVLPLALSVLFNLLQLGLTARALSRMERVTRYGVCVERESSNVCIYARLSSLTGMCWVVALLAEVPGCGWLSYVSAVLNGLQGLHLAVSYVGNRRVLRLWRERVSALSGGWVKSRPPTSSTTATKSTTTTPTIGPSTRLQEAHTTSSSV